MPWQRPLEPCPRQTPLPPVMLRWPEPLAHEPPDCTVTLTAPLEATRPDTEAGLPPPLVTIPLVIATGYRRVGVQAPARVTTTTFQSPSKLLRAKDGLVKPKQA